MRSEQITAADVAAHYDDLDAPYRDLWGEHLHHGLWKRGDETPEDAARALVDLVVEFAEIRTGESVADAGCGYGATARILARERGARVLGYTVSRVQAQWAQNQCSAPNDPRVVLGDWLANEIPSQSQHVVLAIESVEHMVDREEFFRQAHRVLRPRGRIVLCAWLSRENAPAWARRHLLEPIVREGRLASLPSAREHEKSLAAAGFSDIERRDLTSQVRQTWPVCLGRLMRRSLRDGAFRRRFLFQSNEGRAFAATIPRIWIAYRIGAMGYEIIRARKPAA
jgi:tocopherol O-methyltransferase